ncbi:chemotaxis protein CheR [Perkinsela sp. CCAP 1560/4]|nr:chemotaxis protein CheR [Perkinsela sp. CCAP 1560/4]|eukprot:KNH09331.1 chemotaxis protein CheR [Perkinsela sp. CCAP 1560/4]
MLLSRRYAYLWHTRSSCSSVACKVIEYRYSSSLPKSLYKLKNFQDAIRNFQNAVPSLKNYERLTDIGGHVNDERSFFQTTEDAIKTKSYEKVLCLLKLAEAEGLKPLPKSILTALDKSFADLSQNIVQQDDATTSHVTAAMLPIWISVVRSQLGDKFLERLSKGVQEISFHSNKTKDTDQPHLIMPLKFPREVPILPLLWFYEDGHEAASTDSSFDYRSFSAVSRPSRLFLLSVSALHAFSTAGNAAGISLVASALLYPTVDISAFRSTNEAKLDEVTRVWDDILTAVIQGFRRCESSGLMNLVESSCKKQTQSELIVFPPPIDLTSQGDPMNACIERTLADSVEHFPNATINFIEGVNACADGDISLETMRKVVMKTATQFVEKKLFAQVPQDTIGLLRDLVFEHLGVDSKFFLGDGVLQRSIERGNIDAQELFEYLSASNPKEKSILIAFSKHDSSGAIRPHKMDRVLSWLTEREMRLNGSRSVYSILAKLIKKCRDSHGVEKFFILHEASRFQLTWETIITALLNTDEKSIASDYANYAYVLACYTSTLIGPSDNVHSYSFEKQGVEAVMKDRTLAHAVFEALVKMNMVERAAEYLQHTLPISNQHISAETFRALYRIARDKGMYQICATLQQKRPLICPH